VLLCVVFHVQVHAKFGVIKPGLLRGFDDDPKMIGWRNEWLALSETTRVVNFVMS